MYKLFLIIILILFGHGLSAQKRLILKLDSLVGAFYFNSGFDTNYVSRPPQRFMAALHPDFSSIGITIGKNNQKANFYTDLSDKIGVFATYYGYGFGYSIKPRKGKKNDGEFNFRFFCRRFGIETDFSRATLFTYTVSDGDTTNISERSDVDFIMRMYTLYYVFNNKKFSFPAAFDKSYTQIKSCGSVLLGASYITTKMSTQKSDFNLKSKCFGVGMGYGYNFVTKKSLLIHVSAIPTFIMWEKNQILISHGHQNMKYKMTDIGLYCRSAVSYNFNTFYIGADFVFYTTILGDYGKISASFTRNISRLFIGMWF